MLDRERRATSRRSCSSSASRRACRPRRSARSRTSSSGQINIFEGTDLANLPTIEQADTTTVGFVWTPDLGALQNPVFSLDYYDIDINNPIDDFAAQEILDACYQLALASECAKIIRVGGTLTLTARASSS